MTGCRAAAAAAAEAALPLPPNSDSNPPLVSKPQGRGLKPQHRWRGTQPRKTLQSLQFLAISGNWEPSSRSSRLRAVVHHARSQEGYKGMGSSGKSLQRKGALKLA